MNPAPSAFPCFDQPVKPGGYAWWYLDALSDDGSHAVTLIAFVGSAFSPYYARAKRRGAGDPLDHCAINIALYGPNDKRWALTERGRHSLYRTGDSLSIGASAMEWDGNSLTVHVDEVTCPLPSRIRGTVRLYPAAVSGWRTALDAGGRHAWWPVAPCARVEVRMSHPQRQWSGHGYLDSNAGDAPLEQAFARWNWSHANLRDGTAVFYDIDERDGGRTSLAMRFDQAGNRMPVPPPPHCALPATAWRIDRSTRSEAGPPARLLRTLEDTPFYSRSLLSSTILGESVRSLHESLSLDRFAEDWVRMLLPFRMPRSTRARAVS